MAKDEYDDLTPIPRYRGRTVFRLTLLALLGLAGAGVAGYYAWQYRGQLQASSDQVFAAKNCTAEMGKLRAQYDELNRQVAGTELKRKEAETMATSMSADLSTTKEELESLRKQRAETEQRLAVFKELTDRFQKMIDSGKIEVKIRNGVPLMVLPAEVLFPSGSAALSRAGELAVMEVGITLKQLPRRRFMVVGHTDTQPVKSATYKDNWELSTARAVTVTQFLIGVGLSPKMMMAAGHGEHDPAASNKNKAGREKNRRIELILMPDLEGLPNMPKELEGPPADETEAEKPAEPPAAAPAETTPAAPAETKPAAPAETKPAAPAEKKPIEAKKAG
jgi:chemotaxis protein MotB